MPLIRAATDLTTEPKIIIQGRTGATDDLFLVRTSSGFVAMRIAYDGTLHYAESPPPAALTYSERIAALNPWYFSEGTLTSSRFLVDLQLANPIAYTYICRFVASSSAGGGFFGFDDNHGFSPPGPSDRSLYFDSGKIKLYNYNGGPYYLTTPNTYQDAILHTLTARMGGGLPTAIFIDGVKVIETSNTGAYNYSGYYKIGYAYEAGNASGLDIIKPAIFLSALTDTQIIEIHNAQN
jgi:hypothetical protein